VNGARALAAGLCALLAAACSPQLDLVGRVKQQEPCSAARPCDAGCTAADGCMPPPPPPTSPSPSRCPDASGCDSGAVAPKSECESRSCSALSSQNDLCAGDGPALALGDSCQDPDANPRFRYALCSREQLLTQAMLRVDGDVAVDGTGTSVSFGGSVDIQGSLRYRGDEPQHSGDATIRTTRSEHTQGSQCGVEPSLAFDVARALSERASDNDNAAVTASLNKLSHASDKVEFALPCGRYYVGSIAGEGSVTIHAQGHVALFVDGAVNLQQGFHLDADPGARITLVVRDVFNVLGGGFSLGDTSSARHLLIVAGRQVYFSTDATIGGAIYAPDSELLSEHGPLQIQGAAYVRRGLLNSDTTIHYAASDVAAAESCGVD
jgi:hypothetical protein